MSISTTDPIEIAMSYDSALRPISYEADSAANSIEIQKADYTYLPDGLLKEVDNDADHNFDQVSEYDFAGRLKMNDVGSSGSTHPFKQVLGYDAFSNLLTRTNWTYSFDPRTFTATYANNRKASGGSSDSYDVAGNVTYSSTGSPLDNIWSTFDVVGRKARWEEYGPYGDNQYKGEEITYDGDGRPAKRAELTKDRFGGVWGDWNETNKYYIYSSVTGKAVTDLNETGQLYKTHVYVGDAMIADRFVDDSLLFQVTDPLTGSTRRVGEDGVIFAGDEEESRNEQAGLGTTIPNVAPSNFPSPRYENGGFAGNPEGGCQINSGPVSCDDFVSFYRAMGGTTLGGVPWVLTVTMANRVYDIEDQTAIDRTYKEPYKIVTGVDGQQKVWFPMEEPITWTQVSFVQLSSRQTRTNPPDNPNCILNSVVATSEEKKLAREIYGAYDGSTTDYNAHDGMHVMLASGTFNVIALSAMEGTVLHYAKQGISGDGAKVSVLDIKLKIGINGDPLVLSLKDMAYTSGKFKVGQRIMANRSLGSVNGAGLDSLSESGLHVALMPFSAYKKYVQQGNIENGFPSGLADKISRKGVNLSNRPYSSNARSGVPLTSLIDAGRDSRSPFRCP